MHASRPTCVSDSNLGSKVDRGGIFHRRSNPFRAPAHDMHAYVHTDVFIDSIEIQAVCVTRTARAVLANSISCALSSRRNRAEERGDKEEAREKEEKVTDNQNG